MIFGVTAVARISEPHSTRQSRCRGQSALNSMAPVAEARYAVQPMFRRLTRTLLVFIAVLGLLPGVSEMVEHVAELIEHGHPAHSVPGEHDPLGDEHGCTPLQHQCPCHVGQSVAYYGYGVRAADHAEWLTWMIDRPMARRHATDGRHPSVDDTMPRPLAHGPPTPPPNA